jgi:hypothetical protein
MTLDSHIISTGLAVIVVLLLAVFILRRRLMKTVSEGKLLESIETLKQIATPIAIKATPLVHASFRLGEQYYRIARKPHSEAPTTNVRAFFEGDMGTLSSAVTLTFHPDRPSRTFRYLISHWNDQTGKHYYSIIKSMQRGSKSLASLSWEEINGTVNVTRFNGRDRMNILEPLLTIPAIVDSYKHALDNYFAESDRQKKLRNLRSSWDL